ncbi:MAG: hypothetical protein WA667_19860 [Candidatus Nitrosopolaris sp.]
MDYIQFGGSTIVSISIPDSSICAVLGHGSTTITSEQLGKKMEELSASNNPQDIATLVYIWRFLLINVKRTADFVANPNVPAGPGRGPINTFNHFRVFPNGLTSQMLFIPMSIRCILLAI